MGRLQIPGWFDIVDDKLDDIENIENLYARIHLYPIADPGSIYLFAEMDFIIRIPRQDWKSSSFMSI